MNFRYAELGNEEQGNGPLFFKDLLAVLEDRRQNPNSCLIISVEDDDDRAAQFFWTNSVITGNLMMRARVIRIKKQLDLLIYEQFSEMQPINALPSIFVFGPNSKGPSFKYEGNLPNPSEFLQRINALDCPVMETTALATATPELNSLPDPAIIDNEEIRPRFSTPRPKPASVEPENENPKPEVVRKSPIKRVQSQPAPAPKRSVEITVELPNGTTQTKGFRPTETVLTVNTWTTSLLPPGTRFRLLILPDNTPFPKEPFESLAQFEPSVSLKVDTNVAKPKENHRANIMANLRNGGFISKILDFLADLSPFADETDDPQDFWKTEPSAPRPKAHRIAPNAHRINDFQ